MVYRYTIFIVEVWGMVTQKNVFLLFVLRENNVCCLVKTCFYYLASNPGCIAVSLSGIALGSLCNPEQDNAFTTESFFPQRITGLLDILNPYVLTLFAVEPYNICLSD